MKHFKPNVDTKQNIAAAKKAAFADIKEYYQSQDKPVIWCSIRQLNEYFMNLECLLRKNIYLCNLKHICCAGTPDKTSIRDCWPSRKPTSLAVMNKGNALVLA